MQNLKDMLRSVAITKCFILIPVILRVWCSVHTEQAIKLKDGLYYFGNTVFLGLIKKSAPYIYFIFVGRF